MLFLINLIWHTYYAQVDVNELQRNIHEYKHVNEQWHTIQTVLKLSELHIKILFKGKNPIKLIVLQKCT